MSFRLLVKDDPVRSLALTNDRQTLLLRPTITSVDRDGSSSGSNVTSSAGKVRCMVEFNDGVDISDYRVMRPGVFAGTLGLVNVGEDLFLCLIRDAIRVASPRPRENVQRIQSVEFFCVNRGNNDSDLSRQIEDEESGYDGAHPYHSYGDDSPLEHPCLELKRMLSGGTFYYSNDFDITNRLQDRYSSEVPTFDIEHLDEDFLWSQHLIRPLLEFRSRLATQIREALDRSRILTLAIRGFVYTISVPPSSIQGSPDSNRPAALTLISRLSCRRAGTRFNARGIDDDGNVANFVETESILWHPPESCFSYVQTRGSVPLFWEQAVGLLPGQQKIQITRSAEATQPAFNKHFEGLESAYGNVRILNLLSEAKSGEAELSARYKHHVRYSPLNEGLEATIVPDARLMIDHLDFHSEAKLGSSAAVAVVEKVARSTAASIAFFSTSTGTDARSGSKMESDLGINSLQSGIFRTNCLDCLDRTNLVQTVLSQMAMNLFFRGNDEAPLPDFWTRHATLWADNGDALSKIYAGTGALKSSYTRHGKMSIAGALADVRKSASRLYINNFVDKSRQNITDMLLGRLTEQSPVELYDPVTDFVNVELKRRAAEYTSTESIRIWTGTYNLNGQGAGIHRDLTSWLCPPTMKSVISPEIVVVGFQELVELSPQQIMSVDPERRREWERSVSSALNAKSNDAYILLRSGQLVGAALLVFVRKPVLDRIKDVEGAERKLGLSGIAGNKGAVAIRFTYGNTRLCFLTAHLAAGFANIEERNRDFNVINRGLKFSHNRSVEEHDAIIWMGDFNYRIGLGDEKVRQLIKIGDLEELYNNDQLSLQMIAGKIFQFYSEARITFAPTYKYQNGTDEYDRSEKARIPAWCDRILHKGDILKQLSYRTAPLLFSDHRPVYALFQCTINMLDETAKQKLNQSLYEKRREEIGEAVVCGEDDEQDEDFVGFEAVAPGLPPASSDRRKWWLDDDSVRASIEIPDELTMLNDKRPSNPFRPSHEPVWLATVSQDQGHTQQGPLAKGRPQEDLLSEGKPAERSLSNTRKAQASVETRRTLNTQRPTIPQKPKTLAMFDRQKSAAVQASGQDIRLSSMTWATEPIKLAEISQTQRHTTQDHPKKMHIDPIIPFSTSEVSGNREPPNLLDDDVDSQFARTDIPVLQPGRHS